MLRDLNNVPFGNKTFLKTSESFKSTLYEYLIQACTISLQNPRLDSDLADEVGAVEQSLDEVDSASLSRFPVDLSFLVQKIRALSCAAVLKDGILRPSSDHLIATTLTAVEALSQANQNFDKTRIQTQLRHLKNEVTNVRKFLQRGVSKWSILGLAKWSIFAV